jgi:hypothetical protein
MRTMVDLVATYAALGLSIIIAIERVYSRSQADTKHDIKALSKDISGVQSFRDRVEGANVLDRLSILEDRQRADETSLVRVDERLQSVDGILSTLAEELREIGRQDEG